MGPARGRDEGAADRPLEKWHQEPGEICRQYVHAIDPVPTVLSVLGLAAPNNINGIAQSPLDGTSFAHSFPAREAPTRRRVQYYEALGRLGDLARGLEGHRRSPV